MTAARRELTPVTITESYPTHRAGQMQAWAAVSKDGLWKYDRIEITGTPWEVTYVPTGESDWWPSLPKARAATASGSALAQIEARAAECAAQQNLADARHDLDRVQGAIERRELPVLSGSDAA